MKNKTEQKNSVEEFFGKPMYTYTSEQGVDDGILVENPRKETFQECDLLTRNLFERLSQVALQRTSKNIFEVSQDYLLGCLMLMGEDIYKNKKFVGDNDKDFFATPKNEEGLVVWFVRNERNKLTAMLPEDY